MCMQDKIIQDVQDTSHLLTYLATFLLPRPGDSGDHRALKVLHKTSMATRMSAARQLLKALENIHRAGIMHRGDLSRSAKYKVLGRPLKEIIPVVKLWKQRELVGPLAMPENLRTEKFYLGDFVLAMKVDTPVTRKGNPPMKFCSPERLHGKHPTHDGVISDIVRSLGPVPEQWKGLCVYAGGGLDSWYDQSKKPDPDRNLASTIANFRPDADPVERGLIHSIMLKIFTCCPEKRLTATQLLQDPSFRALMEKYGC
ncbi:hypothetical protein BDV34DRAFT_237187 [Aspergillus parasiticus]|uniref:Protein kinase domain-containing protein n=1 Tax=Aspergillus parasiticus TaxID=5067 RepID=A0A5N6DD31_ASPPA|nr:hypothetical protein BDV34DRAFT_237187 [Aspergillus parasiticus]